MMRRCAVRRNVFDPLFMRRIKKTFAQYQEAMDHSDHSAMSREAHVDVDEKGPAWYLGHMSAAMRKLERQRDDFDFVLEVRDARLPFTTENPDLARLFHDKPRLIVFNKADLANEEVSRGVQRYYEDQGAFALFTSAKRTWRDTVETVQKFVAYTLPPKPYKLTAQVGCCVGMPNVGKSSLINSLRVAHEYQFSRDDQRRSRSGETVSIKPGTTRGVKLVPVSKDPNVVLYDTPGMTLPGCFHKEAGLKLAACGLIPTNSLTLTDALVSQYLYNVLVAAGAAEHLAECMHLPRAPVTFDDCMLMLAERSGRSGQTDMANPNLAAARRFLLQDFVDGRLGRVTLDQLPKQAAAPEEAPRLDQGEPAAEAPGFVHEVQSEEVVSDVPPHLRGVMRQLHERPMRAGSGTISRRHGAVAAEGAPEAELLRIRRDPGVHFAPRPKPRAARRRVTL